MLTLATVISALSGGLAGAILTLGGQGLIRFRNRPRPAIRFLDSVPGCVVNTPAWLMDEQDKPLKDENGNIRIVQQRYLRLRIENTGRMLAQNTAVCVTEIIFRAGGAGVRTFAEEVFDLKLALTRDRAIFNLPAGGHRLVDLVHTQQEPGQQVQLGFDFVRGSARLNTMGFGIGQYEMTVFVAAENCLSVTGRVRWSWDGTLDGLMIIP